MPAGSLGCLGSRAKTTLTFRRSFLTSSSSMSHQKSSSHQVSQSTQKSLSHQVSQFTQKSSSIKTSELPKTLQKSQSPTLRRRRTESSILSTSGDECRPRSLSTNRLERSGRSDSWSSLVVGQSPCRHKSTLSTSSHLTTSVDNLCTQYFGKSTTVENVDWNQMDKSFAFSEQVKSQNERRRMSANKNSRRKR